MKTEHDFKLYDHVIWDNDTPPREVCYLSKKHSKGFTDPDGEIVTHEQLKYARLATGREIKNHYEK